jgi:hypothetical protein
MNADDLLLGSLASSNALQRNSSQRTTRIGVIDQTGLAEFFVDVIDPTRVLWVDIICRLDFTMVAHAYVVAETRSQGSEWKARPACNLLFRPV